MIAVGKFDYKTRKLASEKMDNFMQVILHPGNYSYEELNPYCLKDKNGSFIENAYQFRKVYEYVPAQNQYNYVKGHKGKICTWSHPYEKHMDGEIILPAYFEWRRKGLNNLYPVRYPEGFNHRKKCKFLLDDEGIRLDYILGRQIYIDAYSTIVDHPKFTELQDKLKQGINLHILEVDGPIKNTILTPETLHLARIDDTYPMGHCWVVGAYLLGMENALSL